MKQDLDPLKDDVAGLSNKLSGLVERYHQLSAKQQMLLGVCYLAVEFSFCRNSQWITLELCLMR
jgi:hypothetical protein